MLFVRHCVVGKQVTIFTQITAYLLPTGQTSQYIAYSFFLASTQALGLRAHMLMHLFLSVLAMNRRTTITKCGHFGKQARGINV
jgi:hypothetical protein